MKKYVMPVTEIVTVEVPRLLGGSLGSTEAPVKRIDDTDGGTTTGNVIFSETNSADVTKWGE